MRDRRARRHHQAMRIKDESGQTTAEYALVLSIVITLAIGAFVLYADAVRELFLRVLEVWPG